MAIVTARLSECALYYHWDRTHLGREKGTPYAEPGQNRILNSQVASFLRLGGLHHYYDLSCLNVFVLDFCLSGSWRIPADA